MLFHSLEIKGCKLPKQTQVWTPPLPSSLMQSWFHRNTKIPDTKQPNHYRHWRIELDGKKEEFSYIVIWSSLASVDQSNINRTYFRMVEPMRVYLLNFYFKYIKGQMKGREGLTSLPIHQVSCKSSLHHKDMDLKTITWCFGPSKPIKWSSFIA